VAFNGFPSIFVLLLARALILRFFIFHVAARSPRTLAASVDRDHSFVDIIKFIKQTSKPSSALYPSILRFSARPY